ncbi:MAG TPA: 1-deoxy-D-xylulose-5-phosphate reductoisomerase [Leucothrix mucor]|uniref:1-deoxy-D-xylulose 5-phosphate reductoisomerase n=1 Tax=Leucothrix mucor TaxID=45248 RepID=A0A7V2SZR9_LEUMU|nr:1-deoxy-D-xylulose-5-phosphate reductoisomerase [Leucothrix mucor]
MNNSKGITILGSTGSIGVSTLDVISRHKDSYEIIALTANSNVEKMLQQCLRHQPQYAVMVNEQAAEQLSKALKGKAVETTVLSGAKSLEEVSQLEQVDYVMAAIVGAAGLLPNLAAAKAGKRVLLANKESLVMSGKLFMDAIHDNNATLLPIDSEHNAIFQCLPRSGLQGQGVQQILLTASGGPFRTRNIESLHEITPEQAIAHPNWEMGKKISVDSATMMNKGLEVIEACWLFDIASDRIQVVIHPQSTIHSMVSYNDGSVLAQLGNPDMRTPIAYGLGWPKRIDSGVKPLDLFEVARLDFEKADFNRFPCLRLAFEAHQAGGNATIALNAANEIAVDAFLNKQLRFTDIATVVEYVLEQTTSCTPETIDEILIQDKESRQQANLWMLEH